MNEFKISELLKGRPEVIKNEKVRECYDMLDELNIEYERVEYNFFPSEIQDLRLIDDTLGMEGIKNLIFRTKNKARYFFIIIPREERFDEKSFRSKYELPKLSMSTNEDLMEVLNTSAGAVSITELIHDKENIIELFIDKKILEKEYFRFHPNDNKSTLRIRTEDLLNKLLPHLNHKLNIL